MQKTLISALLIIADTSLKLVVFPVYFDVYAIFSMPYLK